MNIFFTKKNRLVHIIHVWLHKADTSVLVHSTHFSCSFLTIQVLSNISIFRIRTVFYVSSFQISLNKVSENEHIFSGSAIYQYFQQGRFWSWVQFVSQICCARYLHKRFNRLFTNYYDKRSGFFLCHAQVIIHSMWTIVEFPMLTVEWIIHNSQWIIDRCWCATWQIFLRMWNAIGEPMRCQHHEFDKFSINF